MWDRIKEVTLAETEELLNWLETNPKIPFETSRKAFKHLKNLLHILEMLGVPLAAELKEASEKMKLWE